MDTAHSWCSEAVAFRSVPCTVAKNVNSANAVDAWYHIAVYVVVQVKVVVFVGLFV